MRTFPLYVTVIVSVSTGVWVSVRAAGARGSSMRNPLFVPVTVRLPLIDTLPLKTPAAFALGEDRRAVAVRHGLERVARVRAVDVLGADARAGATGDAGLADDADGALGVRDEAADAEALRAVVPADDGADAGCSRR